MTLSPPGAQLAPIDLPPPPPSADPREPSPSATRGRATRTPQRPKSPMASRGTSPTRQASGYAPPLTERAPDPPGGIAQPVPRPLGSSPPQSSPPGLGGSGSPSSTTSGGLIGATSPPHGHHGHYHPHHPHLSRPSSPSSIHSSTSAIFERDIELPPVASLSLNPNQTPSHTLSHKSSRLSSHLSHGSALDHSVPAVLDDAVEALHTGTNESPANGIQGLEIESAVPAGGIGMARQSSASIHGVPRKVSTTGGVLLNSRSPSPVSIQSGVSSVASPARSPPMLGKLSTQPGGGLLSSMDNLSPTSGGSGSGSGVLRPQLAGRTSTGPQPPGGWAGGPLDAQAVEGVSPGSQPRPEDLTSAAAAAAATDELHSSSPPPLGHGPAPHMAHGHLGSTSGKEKRRISYISYNDLLLSVPTTVTPLADITSGNLSPDHLPGTISPSVSALSPVASPLGASGGGAGTGLAGVAGAVSPGQTPTPGTGNLGTLPLGQGAGLAREASTDTEHRGSGSWETAPARMGLGLGDGEWGRHGLGRGLEQRLDDLAQEEAK